MSIPTFPSLFGATQDLPQWSSTMDSWGGKLLSAVTAVSQMAALGFDLPADAFSSRMQVGSKVLSECYSCHFVDKNSS